MPAHDQGGRRRGWTVSALLLAGLSFAVAAGPAERRVKGRWAVANDLTVAAEETTNDALAVFGDLRVAGRVRGLALTVGGSLTLTGRVDGDATVIGGNARLGSGARVAGDLLVVGGRLDRAPSARVDGTVTTIAPHGWRRLLPGFGGRWRAGEPTLVPRLFRTIALAWLVLFLVVLGPEPIQAVSERVVRRSWQSFVVGFVAILVSVPLLGMAAIALTLSVVGIPLLPLLPVIGILMVVALLWGYAASAVVCGRRLTRRVGASRSTLLMLALIGVVVLQGGPILGAALRGLGGPATAFGWLLGLLGFVVKVAAWSTGFGAVILGALSRSSAPPQLPSSTAGAVE